MSRYGTIMLQTASSRLLPQLRTPANILFASLTPFIMFIFFTSGVTDPNRKLHIVAGYLMFSIVSGTISQAAYLTSSDIAYGWGAFLRTMPAPTWPRMAGNALATLIFTLLTMLPMAVTFVVTTPEVSILLVVRMFAGLILPALCFGVLGWLIGLFVQPDNIGFIVGAIYMALAIVGGLLTGGEKIHALPEIIFLLVPSKWSLDVYSAVLQGGNVLAPAMALVGTTLLWALVTLMIAKAISTTKSALNAA